MPPSAIAEFNVAVDVTAHSQPYNGIRRFVRCYFLREGDRCWSTTMSILNPPMDSKPATNRARRITLFEHELL